MADPWTKLEWALYWAARGFYVFPLVPNAKTPRFEGGWKLAANDEQTINQYWSAEPEANIGCCLHLSGHCAIDIDTAQHGADGLATWEQLCLFNGTPTPTLTHRTQSGGWHLIYRGELPSRAKTFGPGVDTRGAGGYIVMPGSVIAGRPYEITDEREPASLPSWLTVEREEATDSAPVDVDEEWAVEYARREIETEWIPNGRAPEIGSRNHTMYTRVARLYELGVPEPACVELMREFLAHGHMPEEPIEPMVSRVYSGSAAVQSAFGSGLPPSDKGSAVWDGVELPKRAGRMWLSMAELEAAPPLDFWDSHRMIPRYAEGSVGMVYGAGGAMKTQWLFAKTFELMQIPEHRRPRVAYLAGEGGPTGIGARLRAIRRVLNMQAISTQWFRVTPMPHLFKSEFEQFAIDCEAEGWIPDILIYDTLAAGKAGTPFEEDERLAAELTRSGMVGGLATRLKAAMMVVHHTGKDRHSSERGASGFRFNVDFTIKLTGNDEYAATHVEVWCQRMKDGKADFRVYYELRPDPIEGVPVPVECTETEWNWFSSEKDKAKGITSEKVVHALEAVKALGPDEAKYAVDIAAHVFGGRPAGISDEAWQKINHRIAARLERNAKRSYPGLHMELPDGSIRWFIPVVKT